MCKEKIQKQFMNFRIYKHLYGKQLERDWWQELFFLYKPF